MERSTEPTNVFQEQPVVSFIIPTLNRASSLESLLAKVVEEKHSYYPLLEIIVMDGGSSDATQSVIQKYQKDIAYWESARDDGLFDAFNKGLLHATGKVIRFVSDDDEFITGTTDLFVRYLMSHPEVSVVAGAVQFESVDSSGHSHPIHRPSFSGKVDRAKLASIAVDFWIIHEGIFVRREVFRGVGSYDIRYRVSSDIDFIFRIVENNFIIHALPTIVLRKHIHEQSVSQKRVALGSKEISAILFHYGYRGQAALFFMAYLAVLVLSPLPTRMAVRLRKMIKSSAVYFWDRTHMLFSNTAGRNE